MKRFVLFFLDILILYAALEVTLFLRYGSNFLTQNSIHLGPFSFIFAIWVVIYYITNLYSTQTLRNNIQFYSDLFGASLVAAVISVLLFYFVPFLGITPKRNLFIFLIVFSLLEAGMRWLYNSVLEKNFKKSVLIVGINPQSQELADFVQRHPQF